MTDLPRSASALVADVEADIAAGARRPGDRLPSVRETAERTGLAPGTVASAYKQLRARGLVVGRGRQGTVVAPLVAPRPFEPSIEAGLVDASTGRPDPAVLPDLVPAVTRAAQLPQASYGDPLLVDELIDVARDHLAIDGIDGSHLTVTNGSMDAIDRVLRAQGFRPGDRVGVEDPGHVPVHQVVRSAGFVPVPLAIDEYGIRPDELEREAGSLAAVVLTPRAQNPTGAALDSARAAALSQVLADHDELVLVHDDHAGDIAGAPYHAVIGPCPRWITIRSLGKAFGPDLRLALVAGDAVTVDRVTTSVATGPGWVSTLLQRVAIHLLSAADSRRLVARAATSYERRRALMIDELASVGLSATGRSGLNVWLRTVDEQHAVDLARRAGFAIRTGGPWRIATEPAVRITITQLDDDQIRDLASALSPLAASVRRSAPV